MFQRMIEDFKSGTGTAVRMTSLAAAAGFALFVTLAFLSAAAFMAVLQKYGPVEACLTVAGIFLVISLIVAAVYTNKKRQAEIRAAAAAAAAREAAKSAASSILADPMLLAAGLQLVRAVGLKKLIPLLAVGGVALGFLMSRNTAASSDEEPTDAE
ncbi:hypothetical protein [Rhodopseudomonas sp. P2A-2r]|uniref:hypothetical protein n=1 Tax=unclassified Rhodopseudomonas TaxID=2638247 RepID=UPI0022340986|nr:hypothetical protein [Rhodopseudomonas sp. P2A-2r]UZE52306.1 hypothetical protein ONR75_27240 [Rhodopseudomonas sp. P2A-2r]